jgi:hydrogenase expression/formation protein HypE
MQLRCPLPPLDFDRITLGHGSGGLLTNLLLEKGVFSLFDNPWMAARHDGAVLPVESGHLAFSTDSYVISPIFFPGGNIGELAVNGTVNDLAMCGANCRHLSLSFILEEGLLMREFWEVLLGVKWAAERSGVQVVTGDTKVVERGKGDKVFINTAGLGMVHPRADIRSDRVRPGDKILLSGPVATHGIAILSLREGLEFETSLESDTAPLNGMVMKLLDHFGTAVHLLRDPTRGGVATVLNEVARDTRLGVDIAESSIPVLETVGAACEMLGLDPLYVANEGVFIAVVEAGLAEAMVELLRGDEAGRQAAVIGTVTADHSQQVVMKSRIGGRRVVNMPLGEQLPRIC